MGYLIKKIHSKRETTRKWKVQYETWKNGVRKIEDLPLEDYLGLGFDPKKTIEEAKERKTQLNAQEELKRQQERRNAINARLEQEKLEQTAYLPANMVKEFEDTILFARGDNPKLASHWAAAKRILCELKIDPVDWAYRSKAFYDYFSKNSISPSYVQKLRRVLNDWGNFITRKNNQRFDPIPAPKGNEKERIADAYFDNNGGRGNDSDPLTPELLEAQKSSLPLEVYNWLYLSVWFGLRPIEIEYIRKRKHFEIVTVKNTQALKKSKTGKKPKAIDVQVLRVFQTKLKAISRDKRWKNIPCNLKEQITGLEIIKAGKLTKPGDKMMLNHFGEHTHLYGGRKNFVDLMLDLGYRLEDISSWLGHQSIERTWRSYQNRLRVRFGNPAA